MIAYYEARDKAFSAWCGKKLNCPAHLHPHLELVVFCEGRSVAYADAERCELEPGDIFLTFPSQIHRYESTEPEGYYLLIVDPELLPELSSYFNGVVPTSALLKGAAEDKEILQLVMWLADSREPHTPLEREVRRGHLLALFARLLSLYAFTEVPNGTSGAFRAVVEYCTKHYAGELSLSVLERELHISKYYISHLFAEKLKIGFNDYVNSLRVSHACRFLRHSDLSVTEISAKVGFSTLRTFNRAFLKQTGKTPTDYRKSHQ